MEPSQNTTENDARNAADRPQKGMSGATIAIIAVVALGLLGAGYVYFTNTNEGENPISGIFGTQNAGDAVATVNGEPISRADYEESLANAQAALEAQGADLANAELQTQMQAQVIDSLVNAELLLQAAKKSNFGAEETAVQAEYDSLAAQLGGLEELAAQMAAIGLTDAELREDIAEQLTIQAFLQGSIGTSTIAASEEEIVAFYENVELPDGELPPLEEVREQIAEQLRLQKEQEAIAALLESLRADADIQVLI